MGGPRNSDEGLRDSEQQLRDLLKWIRERKGLTQRTVATAMRTTQSAVSELEAGRNCTRETFHRYADALGVQIVETVIYTDEGS